MKRTIGVIIGIAGVRDVGRLGNHTEKRFRNTSG
jgi:hypothetical protein